MEVESTETVKLSERDLSITSDNPAGYILVFAFENPLLVDYFTEFDIMKKEPTMRAHLNHIKRLKGKAAKREHTDKLLHVLRSHLSFLLHHGYLKVDITTSDHKKKRMKRFKVRHFMLTEKGRNYAADFLERYKDGSTPFHSRFRFPKILWHRFNTPPKEFLEKTLITPRKIELLLRKVHILNRPFSCETAVTRHLERQLSHTLYAHHWEQCVMLSYALSKEYLSLSCPTLSFKYAVTALYFNWAGRRRYNIWNAVHLSLALHAYQKNRIKKALTYFENLYMAHLDSAVINTFGQIFHLLARYYHTTQNDKALAIHYYVIARNLFAKVKEGALVNRLNKKIKELNK